jgi:hypothetical protein
MQKIHIFEDEILEDESFETIENFETFVCIETSENIEKTKTQQAKNLRIMRKMFFFVRNFNL